jgi:hypothetical protein
MNVKEVNKLHNEAMSWAEKAVVARQHNNNELAIAYSKKAFLLESDAAKLIPNEPSSEPTRSILYCSAAWLALNANDFCNARIMALECLKGNPINYLRKQANEIIEK